ncbi:cytochrome P450 [Gigaspora rosea]|uniref:Cytochrome P450 n=1 Tax=Gigaspora rosea TaxID=44941 RepID=A0A397VW41_9GLOM|nr:cytochrome P450 [Gigaspora rosea]
MEATKPQLPLHYIFTYSPDMTKGAVVLKDWMAKKIDWLTTRLHSNIKAIDMYIGDCVEPKVIRDPVKVMLDIISIPFSSVAFGDECCHYDDILDMFRNLTASFSKLIVIPPLLSFIHPWLHQQFVTIPFRFGWNPYSKYRDTIIRRIRPVIEKRLNDRKKLGDDWVAPMDLLQVFLDNPRVTPDFDPNNVDINFIADSLGVFVIASMNTTSNRTVTALYDLAWRKEYVQELYKEAQEINKQCNCNELTYHDFNKMVKLDSFIKESFRNFDDILGLPHICIVKSIYTFKNGYQIPKGRTAILNFLDTHYDEEIQGRDPMKFYAFRHLERKASATKIERNLTIFGNGKHSCPGRFLAVNQIKMVLHHVILKYNITTETGKIPPKRYLGPVLNRVYDGLVFEKRKDNVN